jgi:LysM repeat protein/uncharacterized protein YvpB
MSRQIRAVFIGLLLALLAAQPGRADELPPRAAVSGFVGYAQSYNLSCESRSAADWAGFWGVRISEREFLSRLPRSDDPNLGFVGNPNDPWGAVPPYSYGVHADPVAALLQEYGLPAAARHGMEWEALRAEIAAGRPVIVWVISEMWAGRPLSFTTRAGETVTVAHFEHTMVLTGYTEASVTLLDAYSGLSKSYSLNAFLRSWAVLGSMAVVHAPEPPPEPPIPESYTTQEGDYLHAIAAQWELSWQALAQLNHLVFPFVLEPGQVLLLRGAEDAAPPAPSQPSDDWLSTHYAYYGPLPPSARLYLALLLLDPPPGDPAPPAVETYTVQPGDYLALIASQVGLDWQTLAELNDLQPPYTLYPGQVLKLR